MEEGFYPALTVKFHYFLYPALTVKFHHCLSSHSPERIPKVDDFVKVCLDLGVKMIIDLKSYEQPELTVKYINGEYSTNRFI